MSRQRTVAELGQTLLLATGFMCIALPPPVAAAQTINTYAGGGAYVNSPPLSVAMKPGGLTIGPDGGLYVDVPSSNAVNGDGPSDTDEDNEVFRIDPVTGTVTRVVGNGVDGSSGIGGAPSNVSLNDPRGLAFDRQGNLYIADAGNNRILKVSADPTFNPADPGALPGGPITSRSVVSVFSTSFAHPVSLAFDPSFSTLYVATTEANLGVFVFSGVTKVDMSDGTETIVAGCQQANTAGCAVTPVSGTAATSAVIWPDDNGNDLAFDAAGNLYIAAAGYDQAERVFRVNASDDALTIVAGPEASRNYIGCRVSGAPGSIAFDGAGDLLFVSYNQVCKISPDPAAGEIDGNSPITYIAGGGGFTAFAEYGQPAYGDGGPASGADFLRLAGLAIDQRGNVFVADAVEGRVREIAVDPSTGVVDPDSVIVTTAGAGASRAGNPGGDGNPATAATMSDPMAVAVDATGNLLVGADGAIRRIDGKTHVLTTLAGYLGAEPSTCLPVYGGSRPAACATFEDPGPRGLAVDSAGNVYVASYDTVQRIDTSGTVVTIAGGGIGSPGCGDNGPAIDACLSNVHGLTVDQQGDLYIADTGDKEIREVTPDGTIRTIAGSGQSPNSTDCSRYGGWCPGDGGPATDAPLDPMYMVWSPAQNPVVQRGQQGTPSTAIGGGTLYLTDPTQDAVRVVDLYNDTISTLNTPVYCVNPNGQGGACNGTSGDTYKYGMLFGSCGVVCGIPTGIAMDAAGNLFFSSDRPDAIWEATTPQALAPSPDPWTSTFSGVTQPSSGSSGNPYGTLAGDGGPPIDAHLSSPQALAIDSKGNLYVADERFHRVRIIQGVARARGDVNGDGQVDRVDLGLITQALNAPANGPNDPRDLNHDGVINLLDARILVTLCTYPGCATSP